MTSGALRCYEGFASAVKRSATTWRRWMRPFPITGRRWPVATKWISLIIGCVGMTSACTVWQNCWQNAMRAIYNQTETEANLVSTIGGVGATFSLPPGIVYELYGPYMNGVIGFIMAFFGYFFLWLGTSTIGDWRSYFAANQWLVQFLYFFVGFAGAFTYMTNSFPNVENFPPEQRGRVFGTLGFFLSLIPTLLSFLFNGAFTNGKTQPGEEDQQNLSGYFLTIGIISIASIILCFLFVGPVKKPDEEEAKNSQLESSNDTVKSTSAIAKDAESVADKDEEPSLEPLKPPNKYSEFPYRDVPFHKVVFYLSFWYALVQFVLAGCAQNTYQANIPSFLRSFDLNEHNLLFTSVNTAVQGVSKFASGFISDAAASRGLPRTIVFIVPYVFQTIFLLISAFYGDNFVVFLLTVITTGIGTGFTWSQTPAVLGELFGTKHMSSNWGLAMMVSAAMGFPFSISFGAIYEAEIFEPGEIYCYGIHCFRWSLILLAGSTFCGLVMMLALMHTMVSNSRIRRGEHEKAAKLKVLEKP